MTTALIGPETAVHPTPQRSSLRWTIADTGTMAWRNLIAYTRIPEQVFFSTIQPIMFVLLFRYVFGGAIPIPGISYVQYLMPGIYVQTVVFGAVNTSVGLAEDLQKGLIERFRALPMARAAVLGGRTTADLVRNVFVVFIVTIVGLLVGFRITTNFAYFLAGILIVLFFAYSLSWGFAFTGLSAPNAETAQVMAFPFLFLLTFCSSAFVPVSTMPTWLQGFATHQPVSIVIDAARRLMVNYPAGSSYAVVWYALLWCVGLFVVLAPLAVWKYRRSS